jgi:hypothetical protein
MDRRSESVAVLGAGTASGIAVLRAQANCRVLLLDTILRPICPMATLAGCSSWRPPSSGRLSAAPSGARRTAALPTAYAGGGQPQQGGLRPYTATWREAKPVALAPEHQRRRLHNCELEICWPT